MNNRLDVYLVINNYFDSRTSAQRAIKANKVKVNGKFVNSKSYIVENNDLVDVIVDEITYVSRGGYKLAKALEYFKIDPSDKVVIDIGASTGGFTDCLLKHNARLVYAVDVGTNQLVDELKMDCRVISLENTNFRYINKQLFNHTFSLAVIDVSFISLYYIFETLAAFNLVSLEVVALIKPQFETNNQHLNKNGVVKDIKIHEQVIKKVINEAEKFGFTLVELTSSPIRGEKSGNIEFLGYFILNYPFVTKVDVNKVVKEAHEYFMKEVINDD